MGGRGWTGSGFGGGRGFDDVSCLAISVLLVDNLNSAGHDIRLFSVILL